MNDEQLAALAMMKQFTDFNDLATKSALGRDGIDRQMRAILDQVVEKHIVDMDLLRQQEAVHHLGSRRHRSVSVA